MSAAMKETNGEEFLKSARKQSAGYSEVNDKNERILTKLSVFFHGFVRALSGNSGRIRITGCRESGSKTGTAGCRENSRIKAKAGATGENPDIRKTAVLLMESEELSPP